MANRIRPLRRTGSSGVPVVANMLDGEIAVNSFDKKIYMRVGANLVEIANASSGDWNTLANKPAYANAWGSIDPTSKLDYRASLGADQAALTSDWNNATTQGWWMGQGAANGPAAIAGQWVIGQVTAHNSGWIQQEVWQFTAGAEAKRWRRGMSNGEWGAWTDAVSHGRVHAVSGAYGAASSAFFSSGPYATQQGALAIMWGDARIWQIGAETNGDFKIWSYSDQGAYVGNPVTITGDGRYGFDAAVGSDKFSALSVGGGIKSRGTAACIGWDDRTTAREWNWYSTNGFANLWASGIGNLLTVTETGVLTASIIRGISGFAYGDGSFGGNITWNNVSPGNGMSEYTNNRQGGAGGHLFSTRQNEAQTPVQHHQLMPDGRTNVRTAANEWIMQPRIFSGGGDPGGHASPGDLWFVPV